MEVVHFLTQHVLLMRLEDTEQVLHYVSLLAHPDQLINPDLVKHMHHEHKTTIVHSLVLNILHVHGNTGLELHQIGQNNKQSSLLLDRLRILIKDLQHIQGPINQLHLLLQQLQTSNLLVIPLHPLQSILHKHTVNIDLLLKITNHLVILSIHIVLSYVVVLQLHYKLRQLLKTTTVQVVLHHQLEHLTLPC